MGGWCAAGDGCPAARGPEEGVILGAGAKWVAERKCRRAVVKRGWFWVCPE
jgi:hypothetical protein